MALRGWETYIRKDSSGRDVKDVRPVGAKDASGTLPREYAQAKGRAIRFEKEQKAKADFAKDFARTAAIARRKNLDQSGKG